ncbi:hypothetical protein [Treponema sp. Marseille-Q4523]|jgi:hypothetical protein|uniref:hypothetical protein n=1 Tax=Treponema sp. Marseille-Q4523 TaxID=2810610 RepID=UPI00195F6FC3|nr:hypothetical protein [Treponema sp. Marseille-Q4523]MBM7022649.1 hypothetical protein [Treponema sp. Marseille-Q4523]
MRYNVTVDVPYEKRLPYTLFAKGFLIETPHIDSNKDFAHFKFLGGSIIVLFYTFEGFRRAYIVTGWDEKKDKEYITLPGITEKLCLIFTARGRKVDHLKRCVYLLTKENKDKVFKFPLLFWYRLAGLIQFSGAKKSDVMHLYTEFTKIKRKVRI